MKVFVGEPNLNENTEFQEKFWNGDQQVGDKAVSYTHLDVYKRQDYYYDILYSHLYI